MSQKPSGYERLSGDRYFTPAWVTEALIGVERFNGLVLDPAAGAGHMLKAFEDAGITVAGCDIEPASPVVSRAPISVGDFHNLMGIGVADVVTNPPYGKGGREAVRFIETALRLTEPHKGKVAMLLRVDFDSASTRRHLFADHPAFDAKYTLLRRIRWANLEQSASGPTENHCFMIWDWARRPGTRPYYGYLK